MSPYSGNKCSEEEALDLFYLEIEERILLLISEGEEEEEDRMKKTEGAPLLLLNSSIKQLQPTKQGRRGYYGSENIGKKSKPWIHEYGARNNGGKRVTEIGGRRGTGVFIPKSLVHSC
ncbi:hypothetical protein MA16_Dca007452 [Dendrobium catenatum]|uniref:Uncharacterized protein n=1 Tax=Dendrobium catenatum TaxID=906689 RepID=A0A2I0WAQ8_9ASPA|nr:hypothetical protein MA16_Dca007452 [Dendrobium catenatum]